jgi:hypothetical protein
MVLVQRIGRSPLDVDEGVFMTSVVEAAQTVTAKERLSATPCRGKPAGQQAARRGRNVAAGLDASRVFAGAAILRASSRAPIQPHAGSL